MTEINLEDKSNRNMAWFYREALAQVTRGRRPNKNTIKALQRLGFITFFHKTKEPYYQLTEKARSLLEGVSP